MAKKNVNIASSTEVKKYNYSQVYQTIYQEAQISKQDLATKLQLSPYQQFNRLIGRFRGGFLAASHKACNHCQGQE